MFSRRPGTLLAIAITCTVYGIILIKRGIEGDTLMPGTLFTYLPRWSFVTAGILLQIPLPCACWYLHHIGFW
jgi:hypothetical protein